MRAFLATLLLACVWHIGHAQADDVPSADVEGPSEVNFGFGLGLSYGGIGARFSVLPTEYVSLFAAGGYNIVGFGYSIGTNIRLSPHNPRVVPFLAAMYGYNAVIAISGAIEHRRLITAPLSAAAWKSAVAAGGLTLIRS